MELLRTTSVRIRIANIRYAVVCAGKAWLFTSNDSILPTAEARKKKKTELSRFSGSCAQMASKLWGKHSASSATERLEASVASWAWHCRMSQVTDENLCGLQKPFPIPSVVRTSSVLTRARRPTKAATSAYLRRDAASTSPGTDCRQVAQRSHSSTSLNCAIF